MQKILFFHLRPNILWDNVAATLHRQGKKLHFVTSVEQLQVALRESKYDILLLNLESRLPAELTEALLRLKNVSNFRSMRIFTVHATANHQAIEESILLGAKGLFLKPFVIEDLADHLENWLQLPVNVAEPWQPRKHLPVQLEVLGRVSRVSRISQANVTTNSNASTLTIESNALLSEGSQIRIHSPIASAMELDSLRYRVQASSIRDVYYRYQFKYELALEAEQELRERFIRWNRSLESVFPKTKVLFIGEHPRPDFEDAVEKKLYSFYFAEVSELQLSDLDRIWPKIVIVDTDNVALIEKVKSWISSGVDKTLMVITTKMLDSDWVYLKYAEAETFYQDFVRKTKPFLKSRVQKAIKEYTYISRNSEYSRCSITDSGRIIASSNTYIKIMSTMGFHLGAVVQLASVRRFEGAVPSIYGKVVNVRPVENEFEVTLQYLPISGSTLDRAKDFLQLIESQVTKGYTQEIKKTENVEHLYFLKKRSFLAKNRFVLIFVFFILLVLLGLYFLPKEQVKAVKPATTKKVLDSIRKQF